MKKGTESLQRMMTPNAVEPGIVAAAIASGHVDDAPLIRFHHPPLAIEVVASDTMDFEIFDVIRFVVCHERKSVFEHYTCV